MRNWTEFRRNKLPALDGLRGVASIWVVLHHLCTNKLVFSTPLLENGSMLVDTFFVISGFVMTYQYAGRILNMRDVLIFLWRRIARIWPLHVFILMLMLAPRIFTIMVNGWHSSQLFIYNDDHSFISLIASIFLLHGMGIYNYAVWNGPSWTISVEFFAYVVFCFSVLQRRLVFLHITIFIILTSLIVLFSSGFDLSVPLKLSFFRCLFGFFIGSLTCTIFISWNSKCYNIDHRTLFGSIITILLIVLIWIGPAKSYSFLFPVVCSFFIFFLALSEGRISNFLSMKIMQFLGLWSLGIYLIHIPVLNILMKVGQKLSFLNVDFTRAGWSFTSTIFYIILVLLLSALSHKFIEKNAQRIMNNYTKIINAKYVANVNGNGETRS